MPELIKINVILLQLKELLKKYLELYLVNKIKEMIWSKLLNMYQKYVIKRMQN